ncbi:DNA-binding protein [Knoellia subterranea]|uniref:DNA-binding protein n=1 Tax=Knoellia subterranea TaxID=184882 RepID=UPI000A78450F|nr:DNA-binding protein [Knoellia subterranea]
MGTFVEDANLVTATVAGRALTCRHCDGTRFGVRRIKLNTSGAEFFGFAWANRESLGFICDGCGCIEEFLEGVIETFRA